MTPFSFFKRKSYSDELMDRTRAARDIAPAPAASDMAIMTVEDVFFITGRGTVVTGTIQAPVTTGQAVVIVGKNGDPIHDTITGIEAFNKRLKTAQPGTMVGLLLQTAGRNQISPDDRIMIHK